MKNLNINRFMRKTVKKPEHAIETLHPRDARPSSQQEQTHNSENAASTVA
jgi:hypothetical protein